MVFFLIGMIYMNVVYLYSLNWTFNYIVLVYVSLVFYHSKEFVFQGFFSAWRQKNPTVFKNILAHLSQRPKWVFLIKMCPLSVVVIVNISHFHLLLQSNLANLARNIIGRKKFKFVIMKVMIALNKEDT